MKTLQVKNRAEINQFRADHGNTRNVFGPPPAGSEDAVDYFGMPVRNQVAVRVESLDTGHSLAIQYEIVERTR